MREDSSVSHYRRGGLRIAAGLALAGVLGACVQSTPYTALPTFEKDPRKILSTAEQKRAITEISQQKDAQAAQAAKEIEKR